MKVYLAGPDVFLDDAVAMGKRKAALCAKYGLIALYPLDNPVDLASPDAASHIYLGNQRMMDDADAIIANLTPFRGPSADVGTVYELGYMIGRGKRALGYSNDPALYADRVARQTCLRKDVGGSLFDADGLVVEDFGGAENLMITEALITRGHALVLAKPGLTDPMRDLAGFERCLQILAGIAVHDRP